MYETYLTFATNVTAITFLLVGLFVTACVASSIDKK